MVALQGFLLLATGDLSATRAAQGCDASWHEQDDVALEMIGQLRRTMTQQVQMRERLYDGLCDVVRAKPLLIDDVAAALLPQLQRYCHSDGTGTHIVLEKCVDSKNVIVEPIGKLLRALSLCVALKAKPTRSSANSSRHGVGESCNGKELAGDDDGGVIGAARSMLDKLATWIADTDAADWDMDKETDFSSCDTRHQSVARLLVGMHEVLFEHLMSFPNISVGQEKRLFKGVHGMHAILHLVNSAKPASKGAGKGRKANSILDDRTSLFSFDFARRLLVAEGSGTAAAARAGHVDLTEDARRALRKAVLDDDKVMSLALETAQRQLIQASRSIASCAMQHGDVQGDREHIIKLAPLLLRQFYVNLQSKRISLSFHANTQLLKGRKLSVDREAGVDMSLIALHCVQVSTWHQSRARCRSTTVCFASRANVESPSVTGVVLLTLVQYFLCGCADVRAAGMYAPYSVGARQNGRSAE